MILQTLAHCINSYDFKPMAGTNYPAPFPAIAFDGKVIAGFSRTQVISSTYANAEARIEAFVAIYPKLGICELARLVELTKMDQDFLPVAQLTKKYGINYSENLILLLNLLPTLPLEFQNWIDQKQVSPLELAPLRRIPSNHLLDKHFNSLALSRLSKQEGIKYLELLIDLAEINSEDSQRIQNLPLADESAISQLEALRFKTSKAVESKAQDQLENVTWPNHAQAKWMRRGDRSGIELKMFLGSPQELEKALPQLERALKEWHQNP